MRACFQLAICVTAALAGLTAAFAVDSPVIGPRAGSVALRLERSSIRRVAALEPQPNGATAKRSEDATTLTLEFGLGSKEPDALDCLVRGPLPSRAFKALDDRGRPLGPLKAEIVTNDTEAPRLRVTASEAPTGSVALKSLEGALLAYPRGRRIRFHIPWLKDEVPLRVEYGGGVATLKRFQLVGSDATLWVSVKPPDGFALAPLEQPGAIVGRAMDIYGNLVNGGAIRETVQTATGPEPEFRFTAPAIKRQPSRLTLDVLCISGEPAPHPFRLTNLQLPRSAK